MSMVFFESAHERLKSDYRAEDGVHMESGFVVAEQLAKLLRAEGRNPQMFFIRGLAFDQVGNRHPLVPKPFEGGHEWGGHHICVDEGTVYDPVAERPLPLRTYLFEVFGEPVQMEDETYILDR